MFDVSLKQGTGNTSQRQQLYFQHLKLCIIDISKVEEAILQKENKFSERVDVDDKIFDVFEVSK
jgi:hypothetical protein